MAVCKRTVVALVGCLLVQQSVALGVGWSAIARVKELQNQSSLVTGNPLTTHVLDTSLGRPGFNMSIELSRLNSTGPDVLLKTGRTNKDGRLGDLIPQAEFTVGTYKLRFLVKDYYDQHSIATFYPFADIVFSIEKTDEHYHVPLLISPWGYSTYRGS